MIYKRCSKCGKRIPSGTKCECLKDRHKEYDALSRDRGAKAFYGSAEWISARDAALERDQMMDVYLFMTEGVVVKADSVHHIVPLRDDWTRRCDISNLMSLSHESHSRIEAGYKKDKRGIEERLQAMLIEYRRLADAGGV